jgi:radical SAM protein with 4Fe4S-binding SPASM domain
MSTPKYFYWQDHTKIVYGASRAAIYDFKTGNVYSLNESARYTAHLLESNHLVQSVPHSLREFLFRLTDLKLGYFSESLKLPLYEDDIPSTSPLHFLWLELTDSCNLRCRHCYADAGPCGSVNRVVPPDIENEIVLLNSSRQRSTRTESKKKLDTANWIELIRSAAILGCRQLQFIGGEPLLYRSLVQLIDTAIETGYEHIEIFTNGTLLTEEWADILATRGVSVAISLQGSNPEIQDFIAQKAGSFEQILRGIELLQKRRVKTRLATTALSLNQSDLDAVEELVQRYDISYQGYDVVRAVGRGNSVELLPTDIEVYKSKWLFEPDFTTDRESYYRNQGLHSCWAGRIAVTSEGDVIPCVFAREQVVGNILNTSFEEILASKDLHSMWGLTKDQIEVCQDCEYRYACGDCRPAALSESGNLYAKYPRCTYDPYQGKWKTLNQVLGIENSLDNDSEAVMNCTEQYRECKPISEKILQNTRSEITLVTNCAIPNEVKYWKYSCDPK